LNSKEKARGSRVDKEGRKREPVKEGRHGRLVSKGGYGILYGFSVLKKIDFHLVAFSFRGNLIAGKGRAIFI
jgi:hypothetical protein